MCVQSSNFNSVLHVSLDRVRGKQHRFSGPGRTLRAPGLFESDDDEMCRLRSRVLDGMSDSGGNPFRIARLEIDLRAGIAAHMRFADGNHNVRQLTSVSRDRSSRVEGTFGDANLVVVDDRLAGEAVGGDHLIGRSVLAWVARLQNHNRDISKRRLGEVLRYMNQRRLHESCFAVL
jgi:hypothetical protein